MKKSELTWTFEDYQRAGTEAPDSIRSNPDLCEGDLMTNDEVAAYIKDSIATLRILADKQSPRFDEVVGIFQGDMQALLQLGRLEDDEYNELIAPSNLRFNLL